MSNLLYSPPKSRALSSFLVLIFDTESNPDPDPDPVAVTAAPAPVPTPERRLNIPETRLLNPQLE